MLVIYIYIFRVIQAFNECEISAEKNKKLSEHLDCREKSIGWISASFVTA